MAAIGLHDSRTVIVTFCSRGNPELRDYDPDRIAPHMNEAAMQFGVTLSLLPN